MIPHDYNLQHLYPIHCKRHRTPIRQAIYCRWRVQEIQLLQWFMFLWRVKDCFFDRSANQLKSWSDLANHSHKHWTNELKLESYLKSHYHSANCMDHTVVKFCVLLLNIISEELTCGLSHSGSIRRSPQNKVASSSQPPEWVLQPDASCWKKRTQASPTRTTSSSSASRNSERAKCNRRTSVVSGLCFWVTDWLHWLTVYTHLCCSVERCHLFECHSLGFLLSLLSVGVRVRLLPGGTYRSLHSL